MYGSKKLKAYAKKAVIIASIIAALSSGAFAQKKPASPLASQKMISEVEKNPKFQQQLNMVKEAFSLLESAIKKGVYSKEGQETLSKSQKLLSYGTNEILGVDKPAAKSIILEYYTILQDAQIEDAKNYFQYMEKEIKKVKPGSQEQAKIRSYAWLYMKDLEKDILKSNLANTKQKKEAQKLINSFKTYLTYTSKQDLSMRK